MPEFGSIPATSTDPGSNQFPEFQNSLQTESHAIPKSNGIRTDSWNRTEQDGIPGIPELEPIPRIPSDSALTQFPEFRTRIASKYCGLTFEHNTMHVGDGGDRFRYGIPGIAESNGIETDSGNWWELILGAEPVPQCSTLRNRMYSLTTILHAQQQ